MTAHSTRSDREACSSEVMLLGQAFVCQRGSGRHQKHYEVVQATSQPSGDLTHVVVEWSDD